MKNNNLCVLLSHFYVDHGERRKFDILNYVVDFYKKQGCSVILSAHGIVALPERIRDKIDFVFWENTIDHVQIGRGHPKFCIAGYDIAIKNGYEKIMKCRAEDLIYHDNLHEFLEGKIDFNKKKLLISEQTCLSRGLLGDLFHYGDVKYMKKLWTQNAWNYQQDGLTNLFNNTLSYHKSDISKVRDTITFRSVEDLNWITVDDSFLAADMHNKIEDKYWGLNKYNYYGGF